MNEKMIRPFPALPLPPGPAHECWLVDLTPPKLVSRSWIGPNCPYRYSAAGVIVRQSMPPKGYIRYQHLLRRLTGLAGRYRSSGDLAEFKLPSEWTDEMLAMFLIAMVCVEQATPFVWINVGPSGAMVMFDRLRPFQLQHPDTSSVRA